MLQYFDNAMWADRVQLVIDQWPQRVQTALHQYFWLVRYEAILLQDRMIQEMEGHAPFAANFWRAANTFRSLLLTDPGYFQGDNTME